MQQATATSGSNLQHTFTIVRRSTDFSTCCTDMKFLPKKRQPVVPRLLWTYLQFRRRIAGAIRDSHPRARPLAAQFCGDGRRSAWPLNINSILRRIHVREYSIAAIPPDGFCPEVIAAGITVLESLQKRVGDIKLTVETLDWGSDYYRKHGVMMPADGLENVKQFDA